MDSVDGFIPGPYRSRSEQEKPRTVNPLEARSLGVQSSESEDKQDSLRFKRTEYSSEYSSRLERNWPWFEQVTKQFIEFRRVRAICVPE
jgi:hypothetical protein